MENKFLLYRLNKGLQNELKSNRMANVLYEELQSRNFYRASDRKLVFDLGFGKSGFNPVKPLGNSADSMTDMRLSHLGLKNIKKFPEGKNSEYYGLSFCRDDRPVNAVFLGSNGVGKTSFYSALEFVGMRKMNTAVIRGFEELTGSDKADDKLGFDQSMFLDHYSASENKFGKKRIPLERSAIVVKTASYSVHVSGLDDFVYYRPLVFDAFYCSEYDVRQLEVCDKYGDFIVDQIGLGDYYHSLQLLYSLGLYVKDEVKEHEIEKDIDSPEYDEALNRLILGMMTSKMKSVEPSADISYDLYEKLKSLSDDVPDPVRRIDDMRGVLRSELKYFPQKNWYSEGVRKIYCEVLQALGTLRKGVMNGKIPVDESLLQYFCKFNNFRCRLYPAIMQVLRFEDSTITRERMVENIMNSYVVSKIELSRSREKKNSFLQLDNVQFWDEYLQLVNYLETGLKELFEKWGNSIENTIKEMLNEYFIIDNDAVEANLELKPLLTIDTLEKREDMSVNSEASRELLVSPDAQKDIKFKVGTIRKFVELFVTIKTSRGNLDTDVREEVSPRAYLNTFKYKLFCVAMKLALCCVAKGIYHINYPLVIDDVFDSSDFDSRVGLQYFIIEMMEQHDKLLQDPEYELQLIFFTQDDLIADQIRAGIAAYAGNGNVLFGHIYDYHEFSPDDDVLSFSYDDDGGNKVECKYISVADMIV